MQAEKPQSAWAAACIHTARSELYLGAVPIGSTKARLREWLAAVGEIASRHARLSFTKRLGESAIRAPPKRVPIITSAEYVIK
jgi:hypothetical protein